MNRSSIIGTIFAIAVFLLIPATAQSADIEVSDTCSLADAIKAANTDEASGGCAAGDGADTITLSADITLDAALPLITTEITIEGSGFTILGNGRTHIIGVNSKGALTLNEVTMVGGKSAWGGAIGNLKGRLTITKSMITGNSADQGGAIGNEGTLFIKDSVIQDNSAEGKGGAIFNQAGKVSIESSLFRQNSARINGGAIHNDEGIVMISNSSIFKSNSSSYSGGAIANSDGIVSVINSSFVSNTAGPDRSKSSGGAILNNVTFRANRGYLSIDSSSFIYNSASENGGAISNSFGDLTIINSTFASNLAGDLGGGLFVYDNVDVRFSTFYGNSAGNGGGGIHLKHADIEFKLSSSIIAGNRGGSNCFGRLDLNEMNLIEDGSCFATLSGDPMLSELVEPEDGSPAYYPLLEGSPAIDAAHDDYCPDTDIIGTPRPQGAACDIGAFEYTGPASD